MRAATALLLLLAVHQDKAAKPFPFLRAKHSLQQQQQSHKTTVWGKALAPEDFANAQSVMERNITDVERKAIRTGIKSEVFHKEKTSRIMNSLVYSRWPNNVVPYELDAAFTSLDRAVIAAAMLNVMSNTCIRFRPKEPSDTDWMGIKTGVEGCYAVASYYGPNFGMHEVGLQNPGCVYTGIIVHEFLHILAASHEMSRPDRDDYITIDWLNVDVAFAANFWKMEWDGLPSGLPICDATSLTVPTDFSECVDGTTVQAYDVPYDFQSVMHYDLYSFAVDETKMTLIPKDPAVDTRYIGSQAKLGPSDILGLNKAYSCIGTQPSYGGNHMQGCGGMLNGTIPSSGNLQWIINTNSNYGIRINFTKWTCANGSACDLQIWAGWDSTGPLLANYNSYLPPNQILDLKGNLAYIKYNATDPAVGFRANWNCIAFYCCQSINISTNNWDFLNSSNYAPSVTDGVWTINGTEYYDRPLYVHSSGELCLWYTTTDDYDFNWMVSLCTSDIVPAEVYLYGVGNGKCGEFVQTWFYYNPQLEDFSVDGNMTVACSEGVTAKPAQPIEWSTSSTEPQTTSSATAIGGCCLPLLLNTSSQEFLKESFNNFYVMGEYSALADEIYNDRQVYIHWSGSTCMWYNDDSLWALNACTSARNDTGGTVFGTSDGLCPEEVTNWEYVSPVDGSLVADPTMTLTCLQDSSSAILLSLTPASTTTSATSTTTTTASTTTTSASPTTTTASTSTASASTTTTSVSATTTFTSTTATTTAATNSVTSTSGNVSPSGTTVSTTSTGAMMDCPSCQVVLSGDYAGQYTFLSSSDGRCAGGCVYWRTVESNQFCFQPEGAEPVLACS